MFTIFYKLLFTQEIVCKTPVVEPSFNVKIHKHKHMKTNLLFSAGFKHRPRGPCHIKTKTTDRNQLSTITNEALCFMSMGRHIAQLLSDLHSLSDIDRG